MINCLSDETLQAWMDGELSPQAAAAARSHVTQCAWCAANAKAASQALSLADDAWEAGIPQSIPSARLRARVDEASAVSRRLGLPGGLLKIPHPALAAAVVILAIGFTMVLRNRSHETPPETPQETAPLIREDIPRPEMPALVAPDPPSSPHRVRPSVPPTERIAERLPRPERRRAVASETTRHLEQTQQLLRSIRNAEGETVDWVYDVQISRELLNRNRLLRRRAAQREDAFAERMLVQVEPILLDIANLAEQPEPDEIDSLKTMIREQSIITELQLYAARAKS
jgi:hypothetical protein